MIYDIRMILRYILIVEERKWTKYRKLYVKILERILIRIK